eukprot:gene31572-6764_t
MAKPPDCQGTESDVLYSQSGCLIPDIDPTRGLYVSGCIFVQSADINDRSSPNPNTDFPVLCHTSGSFAHVADQVESNPAQHSLLFNEATEPFCTDQEEMMSSISDLCLTRTMSGTYPRIPIELSTTRTSLVNASESAYNSDLEFRSSMCTSSHLSSMRSSNHPVPGPAPKFDCTAWESSNLVPASAPEFQSAVRRSSKPVPGSSPRLLTHSAPPAMSLLTNGEGAFDLLRPYQAVQGAPGAVDALPKAPDAAPSPFAPPAPGVIPMFQPLQPAASTPLSPSPGLLGVDCKSLRILTTSCLREVEDTSSPSSMSDVPTDSLPPKSLTLVPARRHAQCIPSVAPFQSKECGLLARGCTVLDSIPVMATLLDWSGSRVLYQNMESLVNWGDCQGDERKGAQILEDLSKSEQVLDSLLIDVRNGKECRLLAHLPRPHPPDPSSSPSIRPCQYPLRGGRLATEHSVGSSAHTDVQARAPAGHYSHSQERLLSPLRAGRSPMSRGTPFSACNLEFRARGMSWNLSRSSHGDSGNLSGMVTQEFSRAIGPEKSKCKSQNYELVSCSQAKSARIPSTEHMRCMSNSVRSSGSLSRLAPYVPCNNFPLPVDMSVEPASAFSLGTAILAPHLAHHSLAPSDDVSEYPVTAIRRGSYSPELAGSTAMGRGSYSPELAGRTAMGRGSYSPELAASTAMRRGSYSSEIAASTAMGRGSYSPEIAASTAMRRGSYRPEIAASTAIRRGNYSPEIAASRATGRGEDLSFSAVRSGGSCGPTTQSRLMDLANKQKQWLTQSDRNLWAMGKEAAKKPEQSFHHPDQMQTFCPMNNQLSMVAGGEMRMVGRMSVPAVIMESTGSNIQGMVDEDPAMSLFQDLLDEDSKRRRTYQDIVDEDCGVSPRSVSYSGTEKYFSGSSPAPDAILLLQTDMLASMFPRHVLEHMVGVQDCETPNLSELARSHKDITVMFIDVVGFTTHKHV